MGQPQIKQPQLRPHMRKRKRERERKYGTYYYLDTGSKPRVEIPLGKDYIAALRKYAELQAHPESHRIHTFGEAIQRYRVQEPPSKSPNTIRVMRAKSADDVGDERGAQDATDLLGHDSQRTTSRHYRRRVEIVMLTR